jgi:hypothetical protein
VSFALVSPARNLRAATLPGSAPTIIGSAWLTVIATPPNPNLAATVQELLTGKSVVITAQSSPVSQIGSATVNVGSAGSPTIVAFTPNGTAATASLPRPGPLAPDLAVLRALLKLMTPVHGSWGSGRLLRTSLLSVLITSDGRILAGAVTPAVLYADAALPAK